MVLKNYSSPPVNSQTDFPEFGGILVTVVGETGSTTLDSILGRSDSSRCDSRLAR